MKNDWSLAKYRQYDEICAMLDSIHTPDDFYSIIKSLNYGRYDIDLVLLAREHRQVYNAAQYAR